MGVFDTKERKDRAKTLNKNDITGILSAFKITLIYKGSDRNLNIGGIYFRSH